MKDLHLAVEIGAWWTAAVYGHAGTAQPLYFDGQARLPSGVFPGQDGSMITGVAALGAGMDAPDEYWPDPMALLHTATPATDYAEATAAVAAVLAHVANLAVGHAGVPVAALTVVTDRAWGPKARQGRV